MEVGRKTSLNDCSALTGVPASSAVDYLTEVGILETLTRRIYDIHAAAALQVRFRFQYLINLSK